MKKHLLTKLMLLLCALMAGSSNLWAAKTLTFVQTSTSAGTLTGAPTGVTATFNNTYTSNKEQLTAGNSMTLTLSGWATTTRITGVKLEVRNNKSSGAGTATVKIGSTTLGTLNISGLGNTYQEKTLTITPAYTTSDLVITIEASTSSAYCDKFTVEYEEAKVAPTLTFNNGSVRVGKNLNLTSLFSTNSTGDVTYSITAGESYATLDGSTLTGTAEGSVTVKAEQEADETYRAAEASATITIQPALVLSSIAITTAPTKTSYTEDDFFDATGMVVTATYADESTENVTASCTFTPSLTTALLPSHTSIEVSYTENAVTKTANQTITVTAKPRYAISWWVNGVENKSLSAKEGVSLASEFPEVSAQGGKVFMGWVTTSTVDANYSGSYVNTEAATATAATTYYAVFATKTGEITKVTDNLTRALIGVTGSSYEDWSGKTDESDAVYKGQSAGGANNISAIQLRSNNSNSGIVTTTSGGKAKKVTITWNSGTSSGRTLDIYGKSTAYTAATELYNNSSQGTKLGSIVYGSSTELTIDGDYAYIGMRSNDGAMYIDNIAIEWQKGEITYSNYCTVVNVAITPAYAKSTYVTTQKLDFSGVDGLKAYVATDAKAGGVTMTRVEAAVPENTPLLLIGTADTEYQVPVVASATAPAVNKLVAGDGSNIGGTGNYDYILKADGDFHKVTTASPLAAGKAYLHLTEAPASARLSIILEEESGTTSIKGVEAQKFINGNKFFNLSGQEVVQPTKGLYIVNGRKVVIK